MFLVLAVLLVLPLLSACSAEKSAEGGAESGHLKMASLDGMPEDVKMASETTRESYRFAVANPEILEEIPCYCGCGDMGHHSNYACYVQSDENGKIVYDGHALGCSICVDITQDTMRMMQEGRSLQEIKVEIDNIYGKYGPSNMAE